MNIAPAPLYQDPIYGAPTDPVVIWNREEQKWWMLYTQRRKGGIGVSHIHGTAIGVASSADGNRWLYRGTLPGLDIEPGMNTFWAPEVIFAEGRYHMYVTYITGVPTDWNWERHILHYTAENLWNWQFESILSLSSDRVIDACVAQLPDGRYKLWYKDETHDSRTYAAVSNDLCTWDVLGEEIADCAHEGPNVFSLGGKNWIITDEWYGLGVYEAEDLTHWRKQGIILREGGKRPMDGVMADHADVVVCGDVGYIFYFTHPYYTNENRRNRTYEVTERDMEAVVQVALLEVVDGVLVCDRDRKFELRLETPVE